MTKIQGITRFTRGIVCGPPVIHLDRPNDCWERRGVEIIIDDPADALDQIVGPVKEQKGEGLQGSRRVPMDLPLEVSQTMHLSDPT
jgi:hypothetical protein